MFVTREIACLLPEPPPNLMLIPEPTLLPLRKALSLLPSASSAQAVYLANMEHFYCRKRRCCRCSHPRPCSGTYLFGGSIGHLSYLCFTCMSTIEEKHSYQCSCDDCLFFRRSMRLGNLEERMEEKNQCTGYDKPVPLHNSAGRSGVYTTTYDDFAYFCRIVLDLTDEDEPPLRRQRVNRGVAAHNS